MSVPLPQFNTPLEHHSGTVFRCSKSFKKDGKNAVFHWNTLWNTLPVFQCSTTIRVERLEQGQEKDVVTARLPLPSSWSVDGLRFHSLHWGAT